MVQIHLSELFQKHQDEAGLLSWLGEDRQIESFLSLEQAAPGGLVFAGDAAQVAVAVAGEPAVIVTSKANGSAVNLQDSSVLLTENVALAHAILRQHYHDRNVRDTREWGQIHPSAVIHSTATLAADVVVGPGGVIGENVSIGRRCVIMAGTIIESAAVLGDDCVLHPRVVVGYDCVLGRRVIIKSGAVIGAEGYGFARDEQGVNHRIPQMGTVVIGDDVVIGANCSVDRATYAETRIGKGCKVDALCHIGHNVVMGTDCLLVAQSGIAGSCTLGDRVVCSGQTGILDHKQIVSDAVLILRCGVTEDIKEPGVYAGTPPQPFREYRRNLAVGRHLAKMRHEINALQREVRANQSRSTTERST